MCSFTERRTLDGLSAAVLESVSMEEPALMLTHPNVSVQLVSEETVVKVISFNKRNYRIQLE